MTPAHAVGILSSEPVRRDLVEQARAGDRAAFATLAGASIARLFNIAQLMLNDRDVADDAVQETLVIAWRDLKGLRDLPELPGPRPAATGFRADGPQPGSASTDSGPCRRAGVGFGGARLARSVQHRTAAATAPKTGLEGLA